MTIEPHWPAIVAAPPNAPNIIVFMTDDVGFGACSTFGGPIDTPELDRLAASGLRFNQFHTTAMCSPTRAALLTGRNPHKVQMGRITNRPTGVDGYTTVIPKSAGSVAAVLAARGYSTSMFGKGHVTPEWEMSQAGPFDRWPTGLGFQYFYGFLGYDTSMWAPNLTENTTPIEPPHESPPVHFDELIATRAIEWIQEQRATSPNKPFFMYYATGTAHTPHHAPKAWLDKYKGRFDQGWDAVREETFARQEQLRVIPDDAKLTPRPKELPAWDELSDLQKSVASRLMEAYGAALSYADAQIGRVIDALREMGEIENTLVIFIQGDNGGSAEGGFNGQLFSQSMLNGFSEELDYQLSRTDDIGGPDLYNQYPGAWGWAMNTPFQYYKMVSSHFGGTRNGMVMSWPARIKDKGGLRSQFHFVSDIMATLLEAAGVEAPAVLNGVAQDPLDGISMMYAVDDEVAPSRRTGQIFEMLESFGIYQDGWFAATKPPHGPWASLSKRAAVDPYSRPWELYDIRQDFSQATDIAAAHPEKLAALQEAFWTQAKAGKILPIHPPTVAAGGRPSTAAGRKQFIYRSKLRRLHFDAAPNTSARSFSISADVFVDAGATDGVIVCHGSNMCGYALYVHSGHVAFHYNAVAPERITMRSLRPLAPGRHEINVHFTIDKPEATAGGSLELWVDGDLAASGRLKRTLRTLINQDSFNIGCDTVSPVAPDYSIQTSDFQGTIVAVTVTLDD